MALNPKKFYIGASYYYGDSTTGTGAQTLAQTSTLPDNAIVTECTVYCQQAITSTGALTLTITGGGVSLTSAIAKADLTNEAVVTGMGTLPDCGVKATSAADIGITISHAVTDPTGVDTAKPMLQIVVGYFIGTVES